MPYHLATAQSLNMIAQIQLLFNGEDFAVVEMEDALISGAAEF